MTTGPAALPAAAALPEVCVVYLVRTRGDGTRQVLLGRKKHGLGRGNFVGPGGKLEPGETPIEAAVREVAEESGVIVDPAELQPRGLLHYHFPYRESWSQQSHVFLCERWQRHPEESEEIVPEWFDVDAVPYAEMWDDARFWLPGVLAGGTVFRSFTFGEDLASVVDPTLSDTPRPS